MTTDNSLLIQQLETFRLDFHKLRSEISRVIVGQTDILDDTLIALIGGGHVLLEGVPGLGKTLTVRTLASALQLDFRRIQFTPDLMPSDILGTEVLEDVSLRVAPLNLAQAREQIAATRTGNGEYRSEKVAKCC